MKDFHKHPLIPKTVDILGTTYKVIFSNRLKDERLENNDAYIAPELKIIVLDETVKLKHLIAIFKHEIVHGYLYESGLDNESWANNEEIVDWISLQLDKMYKTCKDMSKQCIKFSETLRKESKNESK